MISLSFFNGRGRSVCAALVLPSLLAFVGCKQESVREYSVPKEAAPPTAAPEAQNLPQGHPPISGGMAMEKPAFAKLKWAALPEGWAEKTPSAMRVASFALTGKDGQTAELGVIPLPSGGNELDLVNMWRQQVQLPEVAQADAEKQAENITIAGAAGKLYEMVSAEPIMDGKWKARMLVAMLKRDGTSWFFKLAGADELVTGQKTPFLEFLKTVSFEDPVAPAVVAAESPAAAEAGGLPAGLAAWTPPAEWSPQTPGQMVLATFAAGKAMVNISAFPGDVGGLLANVNRWRAQVGLGALAAGDLDKNIAALDGGGKLVDVTGTDLASGDAKQLVGVIVPHGAQTWFYKLTGKPEAVAGQKDAFLKFVQTVRYSDVP